jgi:uncharacterized metal-binding protein
MKWPPLVLYMRFKDQNHGFGLWIPLFLIGPIFTLFVLAVFLIVLPFVILALLVALLAVVFEWQTEWLRQARKQLRWAVYGVKAVPAFYGVLCSLTGTKVDINTNKNKVYIAIY